jgi:hypothetical protein
VRIQRRLGGVRAKRPWVTIGVFEIHKCNFIPPVYVILSLREKIYHFFCGCSLNVPIQFVFDVVMDITADEERI